MRDQRFIALFRASFFKSTLFPVLSSLSGVHSQSGQGATAKIQTARSKKSRPASPHF
jgi:hypothetical protein